MSANIDNTPTDLETVIEDTLNDAEVTSLDTSTEAPEDTTPEVESTESADPLPESTGTTVTDTDVEAAQEVVDDFAKRYGLQEKSVTGRENRIPYSRVRKIVEKNEREFKAKLKEAEDKYTPKLSEFETKIKDYETKLKDFSTFEHTLFNNPREFFGYLSQIPAYKEFFDYLSTLEAPAPGQQTRPVAQQPAAGDPMPKPNRKMPDGSDIYDEAGLEQLMQWQARQVEARIAPAIEKRVTDRYASMEQEFQAQRRRAELAPIIDKQIAEARTWPGFTDNEQEITKALQADPNLSLDGAWRKVALPKLVSDRETVANEARQRALDEIKRRPTRTAAPTSASRPSSSTGPRTLEQVIAEEIAKYKG